MRNILTSLIFLVEAFAFSQIQHKVVPGETVYKLSKRYNVTIQEILQANPGLEAKPLKIGETILISVQANAMSTDSAKVQLLTHQVQGGETLYGISKKYGVDLQTLTRQNPHAFESLKPGDVLYVDVKSTGSSPGSVQEDAVTSEEKMTSYQVQAKETLYGLSKRLRLSQRELQRMNPELKKGLKEGMVLCLPAKKHLSQWQGNVSSKSPGISFKNPGDDFVVYIVKESDTMFGIMRVYDVRLEDLLDHNPELKKGLKAAMRLKIPIHKEVSTKVFPTRSEINIVLMLPLLAQKTSIGELSKNAIAFYLGAKNAIDSMAQKKKIYVKVFDTENDKSKIEKFLNTYDFSGVHAIIGPFFRSGVEQVAQALKNEKIPVIAPLSASEALDVYPNVIQAKVKDQYLAEPIVEEIKRGPSLAKTVYLIGAKQAGLMAQHFKSLLLRWRPKMQIVESDDLSQIPSDVPPFFAILMGEDPTLGESFVQAVQTFKPGQIIPLGMGYNAAYYNNVALLKKYGFIFTVRYHTNKDEVAQRKLDDLQKKFSKTLDKYELLGFDLTLDILERLLRYRKLLHHVGDHESVGLVSKYCYEKLSSGGYVNKGAWLNRMKSFVGSDFLGN